MPPARQAELAKNRIGRSAAHDEAGALYLMEGGGQTGLVITDSSRYSFYVINSGKEPLSLYLTNWSGDKTLEVYNSTQDSLPLRYFNLARGEYYLWARNIGPYAFQVSLAGVVF